MTKNYRCHTCGDIVDLGHYHSSWGGPASDFLYPIDPKKFNEVGTKTFVSPHPPITDIIFNPHEEDKNSCDDLAVGLDRPDEAPLEKEIRKICEDLANLLVDKNRKYGNSALNPVRVFSHSDPAEQLRVRLDDKLSRIVSGQLDDDEEVILDLIGYLILYLIHLDKEIT